MTRPKGRPNRPKPGPPDLGLDPSRIEPTDLKARNLTIRLSDREHRELREMADTLGVSVTHYLLSLHRQARAAMQQKGGK